MYSYVLEQSMCGDPWEFMAVFSSPSAAEKELVSAFGSLSLEQLEQYRLVKVVCDDRLWSNRTPVPWSAHISNCQNSG